MVLIPPCETWGQEGGGRGGREGWSGREGGRAGEREGGRQWEGEREGGSGRERGREVVGLPDPAQLLVGLELLPGGGGGGVVCFNNMNI